MVQNYFKRILCNVVKSGQLEVKSGLFYPLFDHLPKGVRFGFPTQSKNDLFVTRYRIQISRKISKYMTKI